MASTRGVHGRLLGFGVASRDDAGRLTVTSTSPGARLRELRRMAGREVGLHVVVHAFGA
jgi:hypothetical protein